MHRYLLLFVLLLAAPLVARAEDDDGKQDDGKKEDGPLVAHPSEEQAVTEIAEFEAQAKTEIPEDDVKKIVGRLLQFWNSPDVTDGTKKDALGLLDDIAKDDRINVMRAGIEGYGGLDADTGGKRLMAILKKEVKAKEPSVDVYGTAFEGLKRLADDKKSTVSELIKLLRHKTDDISAKAADALGGYARADGDLRKELVEEIIKNSEGDYSTSVSASNASSPKTRRWNVMKSYVLRSLKALTGQKFDNPSEARSWFNDHKKDKDVWKDFE